MNILIRIFNIYLVFFMLGASISLLDTSLRFYLSLDVFQSLSWVVAIFVLLASPLLYLCMGLIASVPKRFFLLPVAYPVFSIIVGSFAAFGINKTLADLLPSLVQFALAGYVFYMIYRENSGKSIFYQLPEEKLAIFRFKHTFAFAGINVFAILPAALITGLFVFSGSLNYATRGFVSFGYDGLYSSEKVFEKGESKIKLLGMAHIGDAAFYKDIKASLNGQKALMLMEGVTDEQKLLQTPPDYSFVSDGLGVDNQREEFKPEDLAELVEIERADLDISDFASGTVEILNMMGKLYSKKGFSLVTMLELHNKLGQKSAPENLMGDLVTKRNAHLLSRLSDNLDEFKLIILPWGAMHLPEIERWVALNGYQLTGQKSRKILAFSSVWKKIFG